MKTTIAGRARVDVNRKWHPEVARAIPAAMLLTACLSGCALLSEGRWNGDSARALDRNWRLTVQWESGKELSVPAPLPGEVAATPATDTSTAPASTVGTVGADGTATVVVPDMDEVLAAGTSAAPGTEASNE